MRGRPPGARALSAAALLAASLAVLVLVLVGRGDMAAEPRTVRLDVTVGLAQTSLRTASGASAPGAVVASADGAVTLAVAGGEGLLVRLTDALRLDTRLGSSGAVTLASALPAPPAVRVDAIAGAPDGALVAGVTLMGGELALVRILADGRVEPFGPEPRPAGSVLAGDEVGGPSGPAETVIARAGSAPALGGPGLALEVERFAPDGRPTGTRQEILVPPGCGTRTSCRLATLAARRTPAGAVLVAVSAVGADGRGRLGLVRLDPARDHAASATAWIDEIDPGLDGRDRVALAVGSQGRIAVAGPAAGEPRKARVSVRSEADLAEVGVRPQQLDADAGRVSGLAFERSGAIVVAHDSAFVPLDAPAVWSTLTRLAPDGTVDPAFAVDGLVRDARVVVLPDAEILVVGRHPAIDAVAISVIEPTGPIRGPRIA